MPLLLPPAASAAVAVAAVCDPAVRPEIPSLVPNPVTVSLPFPLVAAAVDADDEVAGVPDDEDEKVVCVGVKPIAVEGREPLLPPETDAALDVEAYCIVEGVGAAMRKGARDALLYCDAREMLRGYCWTE